jgi:hypothetical protein
LTLGASDVDVGDSLSFTIVNPPDHGTLTGTGASRTYTPAANYNGPDSFTFKATDSAAVDSNIATVSLTVTAVNDAPVAEDQSASTPEGTAKALTLAASDVEVGALEYTIVSGPTHGSLSGTGADRTYTPDATYHGPDSFTFKVSDGALDSNVATVSLTVTSVNEAPVAQGQSASTQEDTAKALVLAASDGDGDPLTYTIVSPPAHGTLSGAGANQTYTPAANYSGADSFTFQVNDGTADSNVATVSLTVNPVNDAPSCPAQVLTVDEDTPGSKTPVCTDVEGQAITLQIVDQPAEGTAEVVGGELRFVPAADANGADSFTYRGTDGALAGSPATVSVTVNPMNDAPTCNPVSLSTQVNTTGTKPPACIDVEGDPLTYEIVTQPDHGTASIIGQELSYTPVTDYSGPDLFTYRAGDGTLFSPPADVTVTVGP